jgi:hypothetical protein
MNLKHQSRNWNDLLTISIPIAIAIFLTCVTILECSLDYRICVVSSSDFSNCKMENEGKLHRESISLSCLAVCSALIATGMAKSFPKLSSGLFCASALMVGYVGWLQITT